MGFKGGSALIVGGLELLRLLVSNIAAAAGLLAWVCIDTIKEGKSTIVSVISGAIAGLVGIIPVTGFVDVGSTIIIGLEASIVLY